MDTRGYVPVKSLASSLVGAATHRVRSLRTFIYSRPDFKGDGWRPISMNSRLVVEEIDDRFAKLAGGEGYVFSGDACPLDLFENDFVAVALRFLHTPYRWAGRTSLGLDCSALVQMSLMAAGYHPPRDSTPQRESVGVEVAAALRFIFAAPRRFGFLEGACRDLGGLGNVAPLELAFHAYR